MPYYFQVDETELLSDRYRLPEMAHLNTEGNHQKDEVLDKSYQRTKNTVVMMLIVMMGFLSFVILWNLKMALGIDLLDGPHHEFIDVINEIIHL
jgi:hypothetical protein